MYLSEQFTKYDFLNMEKGNNYCFFSEPDSGKTTLIREVLQPLAKERKERILFLYHRKFIGDQMSKHFDDRVFEMMSYQKLERLLKKNVDLINSNFAD